MWDPYATERSAQYRFWFDVREPGAAKYAGQIGAQALIWIWFCWAVNMWLAGKWALAAPLLLLLPRAQFWMVQLSPAGVWLSVAMSAAMAVYAPGAMHVLAWVQMFALPPASYAAWTLRKHSRQARWEYLGITAPATTKPLRRAFLRWMGLRPAT